MDSILPGAREGLERAREGIYAAFRQGRIDADTATARLLAFAYYARRAGPQAVGRRLERLKQEARGRGGAVAATLSPPNGNLRRLDAR